MTESWFALWTRSRHEQVVREQLEQKAHRSLPADRHPLEPLEGPQEEDRLAAFSRLLFRALRSARTTAGARNAPASSTSFHSKASRRRFPSYEIDGIRRLVESDLAYDPCPLIREGMMVEVVHGPLTGVVGRLVRKSEKARLVLSVDLIGQAVSVEVDAADVRPY